MHHRKVRLFTAILFCFGLIIVQCKNKSKDRPMEDVDGNIYKTITVGTQFWMAEKSKNDQIQRWNRYTPG